MPIEVTAVPRPGPWLDALVAASDDSVGAAMTAAASSSVVPDPEGGPRAAIDGDLETAWIASADDRDPTLSVAWGSDRYVRGLLLRQRLGLPASRPLSARVRFADGHLESGRFDSRGFLEFREPVRTSSLEIRFPLVQDVYSVDPANAGGVVLPVGVADLSVLGALDLMPRSAQRVPITIPCAEGPVVSVAGMLMSTTGRTTLRDLTQALPVDFSPCGNVAGVRTAEGDTRVLATGGDRWSVRRVVLGDRASVDKASQTAVEVIEWDAAQRVVDIPARSQDTLLVVRENANPGWVATVDGVELRSVRPDGWQQGWIVPAGEAATVVLSMRPNGAYVGGLAVGLVAALALLMAALLACRRPRDPQPAIAPLESRRLPTWAGWSLVAVALVVSGGLVGAVAVALSWGLSFVTRTRSLGWVGPAVAGTLVAGAGVLLALGPWPVGYAGDSVWAAVMILMALGVACAPWGARATRPASQDVPGPGT